ncbi:hypothetical protein KP509_19G050700 [Ceratopteris richardii]|uniref:Uncharacterized protein n=1 Tax=Ceratopteris richardii TaxID=49495 RepID=A0A8T2SMA6_CERRI|nr:hypothetical protein KP509_19G050700 [Ceratopteris richardii]
MHPRGSPHSTAQIEQPLTQPLVLDAQPPTPVAAHFSEDYMAQTIVCLLHTITPVLSKAYGQKLTFPTCVSSPRSPTSAPLADEAPLTLPYTACDKLGILQPSAQHGNGKGSSLSAPFCGHATHLHAPAAFRSLDSHGPSTARIFQPLAQQLAQHARFISTSAHPNMPIVAFLLAEYIAESVDCLLHATPHGFSDLYVSIGMLPNNVGSNLATSATMVALNDSGTPTFPSASENRNDLTRVQIECRFQLTPTPMRNILPHKFFTNESIVLLSPVNHTSAHTLYFIFEFTDDAIIWHGHLLGIVPSNLFKPPTTYGGQLSCAST